MSGTLEQPSGYGKQPPSVGATGTGPVVRAWANCPTCANNATSKPGIIQGGQHIGAGTYQHEYPCATCAAHWKGVDEAAREMRKAAEQELLDPANASVPAGVLAEYIMALPLPGATKGNR